MTSSSSNTPLEELDGFGDLADSVSEKEGSANGTNNGGANNHTANAATDGSPDKDDKDQNPDNNENGETESVFVDVQAGDGRKKIAAIKRNSRNKTGMDENDNSTAPSTPLSPTYSQMLKDPITVVEKKLRSTVMEAFEGQKLVAVFKAVYLGAKPTKLYSDDEPRLPSEIML